MQYGLENNSILYYNLENAHKKMKIILNDQFKKLRNHFS